MSIRSVLWVFTALALCLGIPADGRTGAPVPAQLRAPSPRRSDHLSEQGKLAIIRYVYGEYAKALQALPHERNGFKVVIGKPLNMKELKYELRHDGVSANPGETVEITDIKFHSEDIAVQINGGGREKFHLRDHLQISMGGSLPSPQVHDHSDEGRGTTIILDYGRPLPDLSPDDLKHDLSLLLDFSKQSAAVDWFDTLPANVQQAIRERRAIVGMDEEMVIAALGRADRKVRERDALGKETTTWIYGTPPAKTVFVVFIHGSVTAVEVFNDPNSHVF